MSCVCDVVESRIARVVGATTIGYLHDGWNVVQQLNVASANALKTNYKANVLNGLALDERYLRIVAPNGNFPNLPRNTANPSQTAPMVTSLLTDALGSTLMVAKADQVVHASYVYEAYGGTTQATPAGQPVSDNPYQYTGRENEAASTAGNQTAAPLAGLYYYRNRFYSVALRRFVSEDPIDFACGSNFYAYLAGRPIDDVDPEGLHGEGTDGRTTGPIFPNPVVDANYYIALKAQQCFNALLRERPKTCEEHRNACLESATQSKKGNVYGASRCLMCEAACKSKNGEWPRTVPLSGGGYYRCTYE